MPRWLSWLLFSVLGGLGLIAVKLGWLDIITDENLVAAYLQTPGPTGLLTVAAAGTLYTAFGGPRQLLAFVLGFVLNPVYGTLLSTLITVCGAATCFYTARLLLRQSLSRRLGDRMDRFDQLFRNNTTVKILMVRLLPVGSNLVTNLLAGCSSVRFLPFSLGSGIGYLPQMLIFALAGAGIGNANHYEFAVSLALFIVVSLLGGYLYHQQRNQALTTTLSEEL